MLLIKVDQCLNGRYVNSVYGDSLQLVQHWGWNAVEKRL